MLTSYNIQVEDLEVDDFHNFVVGSSDGNLNKTQTDNIRVWDLDKVEF